VKQCFRPTALRVGFDNVSEAQHTSSFPDGSLPGGADKAWACHRQHTAAEARQNAVELQGQYVVKLSTEKVYLTRGDTVVLFSSSRGTP